MKEWWNNLVLREKQMVSLGALVVGLLLIYLLIWSPLNNKVASLRHQIRQNQELLAWMQETDKRIQSLEKSATQKSSARSKGSLLNIIQKEINKSPLSGKLSQLHQVESDSVQLTFQAVDFDKLMQWLIKLTQQQGLLITQISVTPSGTVGTVAADLVLKG